MPTGVVKTKKDEEAWNRAKSIARKQYPKIKEDSDKFYAIVMTIYKNITGYKPKKSNNVGQTKGQKSQKKYKILYRD